MPGGKTSTDANIQGGPGFIAFSGQGFQDSRWRSLLRPPSARYLAEFHQQHTASFSLRHASLSGLDGTLEGLQPRPPQQGTTSKTPLPPSSMTGIPPPNGTGSGSGSAPNSKDSTRTSFTTTGSHMTTGLARPGMPPPAVVGSSWPFGPHPPVTASRLFSRGLPTVNPGGGVFPGHDHPGGGLPPGVSLSGHGGIGSTTVHSSSHNAVTSPALRSSPQHLLAPYIYPHLPHASHPGVGSFPYHSAYASLMPRSPFGLGHSDILASSSRAHHRPPNLHIHGQSGPGSGTSPPNSASFRQHAAAAGAIGERSMSESSESLSRRLSAGLRSPTTPTGYLQHMYFNRGDIAPRLMPAPRRFHYPQDPTQPTGRLLPPPGGPPGSTRFNLSAKQHGNETMPYYPCHFMKGTLIQLGNEEFKCVEDLCTEDFVKSANLCSDLKMNSSTVVRIEPRSSDMVILSFSVGDEKVQVSVEATIEHPFFVMGQGWSSCSPERSLSLYRLTCKKLQVGDVCMSLTHVDPPPSGSSGAGAGVATAGTAGGASGGASGTGRPSTATKRKHHESQTSDTAGSANKDPPSHHPKPTNINNNNNNNNSSSSPAHSRLSMSSHVHHNTTGTSQQSSSTKVRTPPAVVSSMNLSSAARSGSERDAAARGHQNDAASASARKSIDDEEDEDVVVHDSCTSESEDKVRRAAAQGQASVSQPAPKVEGSDEAPLSKKRRWSFT